MADLTYNGVTLSVCKTNSVHHRAIYTEDNTTYLYTEVTIDVDGVFNPGWTAYDTGPTATPGTLPPATLTAIRHTLLIPQQLLAFTTPDGLGNVVDIVRSPAGGHSVDVNNGPQPISCTVREINGARTWLVNYKIRTWIHECPDESRPSPLLSNRWSQTSAINFQHLATKTTSGIAHFRSDVLADRFRFADDYRSVLFPPISPGYARTDINVVADPAGTIIHYTITDAEQMTSIGETSVAAGGSGIVKIEGYYGISSISTKDGIAGGTTMAQCDVKAWGSKTSSNWVMIQRCFEIVLAKIAIGQGAIGFIRQASIRESLMDRYVEVNIGFQQAAPNNAAVGALRLDGMRKDVIFTPTTINPAYPNDRGSRGTAQEVLVVAALTEACNPQSTVTANTPSPGQGTPSIYQGPIPNIQIRTFDVLPEPPSPYSTETQEYPYTSGRIDILYHRKDGILAAPTTSGPSPSSSSSSSHSTFPGETDPPPVSVFRTHRPIGYKVVQFTMERVGAMPSIPDPRPESYDGETNLVLIDSEITAATPQYVDDGASHVYRVSGRYKYVFSEQTIGPGDALNLGALPWTSDAPGSNTLTEDDYNVLNLGGASTA